MSFLKAVCSLSIASIVAISEAWAEVNYAQYKPGNLETILATKRPETGVNVLAPQKLRFEVALAAYAVKCDAGFVKAAMIMAGAPRQAVENVPISSCIK